MWWRLSRVTGGGTASNDCIEVGRTIYRRELQGAKEAAVALLHKAGAHETRILGLEGWLRLKWAGWTRK